MDATEPTAAEVLVLAAQEALEAGDLDVARAALLQLPQPRPVVATLLISELELARGDQDSLHSARGRLKNLLMRPPEPLERLDAAWAEVLLGASIACLGDHQAAQPHFARGLAQGDGWDRGEYGAAYAATLIELGKFKEALRYLDRLDDVEIAERTTRSRWHRRQDHPEDALAALRPDDGPAWDAGIAYEAACSFRALGDDTTADRWCDQARRLRPIWFRHAVRLEPEGYRPCSVEDA